MIKDLDLNELDDNQILLKLNEGKKFYNVIHKYALDKENFFILYHLYEKEFYNDLDFFENYNIDIMDSIYILLYYIKCLHILKIIKVCDKDEIQQKILLFVNDEIKLKK